MLFSMLLLKWLLSLVVCLALGALVISRKHFRSSISIFLSLLSLNSLSISNVTMILVLKCPTSLFQFRRAAAACMPTVS